LMIEVCDFLNCHPHEFKSDKGFILIYIIALLIHLSVCTKQIYHCFETRPFQT
jgi:hypothetical protein